MYTLLAKCPQWIWRLFGDYLQIHELSRFLDVLKAGNYRLNHFLAVCNSRKFCHVI